MNSTFSHDLFYISRLRSSFFIHPVPQILKHDACNLKVKGLIPCDFI